MKRVLAFFFFFVAVWGGGLASVQAGADGGLSFRDAFLRYMGPKAPSAAAYFTIVNQTDKPDRLVSATSSAAEHIELHRIMNDHGVRRMHEVEEILVPPHGTVALKPGAYHLMLVGLKQPLVVGAKVPVELHFAVTGRVRLILPVTAFRVTPQK